MMKRYCSVTLAMFVALCGTPANAGQFSIIHSFSQAEGSPTGSLVEVNGLLTGMTNAGSLFSIAADGSGFQTRPILGTKPNAGQFAVVGQEVFSSFNPNSSRGGIVAVDTVSGQSREVLDDLKFTANGNEVPTAYASNLTASGNWIFGVARLPIINGSAMVFRVDSNGQNFQPLYVDPPGAQPEFTIDAVGQLLVSGTAIYGVSEAGLYTMNVDGSGARLLSTLGGHAMPVGLEASSGNRTSQLVMDGSVIYGTTLTGGANSDGTLFRINSDGSGYQLLHTFHSFNDRFTLGQPILIGSTLYGTTGSMLYSINTDGSGFNILAPLNNDPSKAGGSQNIIAIGSTIYGRTTLGGDNGLGAIFQYTTTTTNSGDPQLPEPSSFVLSATGMLAGLAVRRRNKV